jgi:ribosome-binding protein aMBF1 (putative translation factor)
MAPWLVDCRPQERRGRSRPSAATASSASSTVWAREALIGARLASARVAAGINQEDAAAQLGVAQSAIAKIETGRRTISFLEAADLADLYGIPLAELDPRRTASALVND